MQNANKYKEASPSQIQKGGGDQDVTDLVSSDDENNEKGDSSDCSTTEDEKEYWQRSSKNSTATPQRGESSSSSLNLPYVGAPVKSSNGSAIDRNDISDVKKKGEALLNEIEEEEEDTPSSSSLQPTNKKGRASSSSSSIKSESGSDKESDNESGKESDNESVKEVEGAAHASPKRRAVTSEIIPSTPTDKRHPYVDNHNIKIKNKLPRDVVFLYHKEVMANVEKVMDAPYNRPDGKPHDLSALKEIKVWDIPKRKLGLTVLEKSQLEKYSAKNVKLYNVYDMLTNTSYILTEKYASCIYRMNDTLFNYIQSYSSAYWVQVEHMPEGVKRSSLPYFQEKRTFDKYFKHVNLAYVEYFASHWNDEEGMGFQFGLYRRSGKNEKIEFPSEAGRNEIYKKSMATHSKPKPKPKHPRTPSPNREKGEKKKHIKGHLDSVTRRRDLSDDDKKGGDNKSVHSIDEEEEEEVLACEEEEVIRQPEKEKKHVSRVKDDKEENDLDDQTDSDNIDSSSSDEEEDDNEVLLNKEGKSFVVNDEEEVEEEDEEEEEEEDDDDDDYEHQKDDTHSSRKKQKKEEAATPVTVCYIKIEGLPLAPLRELPDVEKLVFDTFNPADRLPIFVVKAAAPVSAPIVNESSAIAPEVKESSDASVTSSSSSSLEDPAIVVVVVDDKKMEIDAAQHLDTIMKGDDIDKPLAPAFNEVAILMSQVELLKAELAEQKKLIESASAASAASAANVASVAPGGAPVQASSQGGEILHMIGRTITVEEFGLNQDGKKVSKKTRTEYAADPSKGARLSNKRGRALKGDNNKNTDALVLEAFSSAFNELPVGAVMGGDVLLQDVKRKPGRPVGSSSMKVEKTNHKTSSGRQTTRPSQYDPATGQ